MKITREADYAIRIVCYLNKCGEVVSANEIANESAITTRFALKILRKLILVGMVKSRKGVNGGYELNLPAQELNLGRIIEVIDGPIEINHCLNCDFRCTRVTDKDLCCIRGMLAKVNNSLKEELYSLRIDEIKL